MMVNDSSNRRKFRAWSLQIGIGVHMDGFAAVDAAPDAAIDPAARHLVEHRDILGHAYRVPESDYIGCLANADLLGTRGDIGAEHERIGTGVHALVVQVMFGEPEGIPLIANRNAWRCHAPRQEAWCKVCGSSW